MFSQWPTARLKRFTASALFAMTCFALAPANAAAAPLWRNVASFDTTLPSGDAALVVHPVVPEARRDRFEDRFPVITVLQGGLVAGTQYSEFAEQVAKNGFVVVLPTHMVSGFGPFPVPFPAQESVTDVLAAVGTWDADASSPVYKIIDTETMGIVGHSIGGVAALNVASSLCLPPTCSGIPGFSPAPPQVKAAVAFGTSSRDPRTGEFTDYSNLIPTALIGGTLDGKVPFDTVETTYGLLESEKALVTVFDVNHFGITNDAEPAGAELDPNVQTVSQAHSHAVIGQWTAVFFNAKLKDRPVANWILDKELSGPFADVVSE